MLALLVLAGLVFFGVSLLAGLFFNKQTRPIGAVLLAVILFVGGGVVAWRLAMQNDAAARHAQAVSQTHAVSAEMRGQNHDVHWHEEGHTMAPNPAQVSIRVPDQVSIRMSWAGVAVVALILFAVMKLLNRDRGLTATGWLGLAGLGLMVLIVVMNYLSLSTPSTSRPAAVVSNEAAPPLTAGEAWDEITRPRIRLEEEGASAPPQSYTVVVNGRELTYNEQIDIDNAISEIKKIWLSDGKNLKINYGSGEISMSGGFQADVVGDKLHQALVHAREQHAADAGSSADNVADEAPTAETSSDDPAADGEAGVKQPALADAAPAPAADAAPAALPDWVTNTPPRIGEVYRRVIEVGPYATVDECFDKVSKPLMESACEFAGRRLPRQPSPELLRLLGFSEGTLLRDIAVDQHVESVYSPGAGQDMKVLYLRLEFDQDFSDQLDHAYKVWRRGDLVNGLTLLTGAVLLLLGGVFGLLKLDEATKGYYTKRLFIGVPAAIIGVLLLAVVLEAMGIVI
ncbi:hypothetical protein [Posidoniimonas polymericola]|uniref:hypothetical protein n=1 Tax=Posidoniimonas polymericola TaxID=2528002 RepID=UPI0011B60F6C|nr:hypothetical protein [Posidoniimonas polymericola]